MICVCCIIVELCYIFSRTIFLQFSEYLRAVDVAVKKQDYRIESTWKQRHAAMTPLFIETQSTLATQAPDQSTLRDGGVSMSAASAQLRMTVDIHSFTATQADGQTS